jgi:hypothetical protein
MNILKYYKLPLGKTIINANNAVNNDIIDAILLNYQKAVKDSKEHAKAIKTGNFETDARNIWETLKTNLIYQRDLDEVQTIKLPRVAYREKYTDCKTFALCGAGLAGAMGYEVTFRFAGYKTANGNPSHVYFYISNGSKKIIIDGCAPRFNWEKKYKLKIDKKMKVITLNDEINDDFRTNKIGRIYDRLPKQAQDKIKLIGETAVKNALMQYDQNGTINKKVKTPAQTAKAKQRKEKVKEGFKKFGHANMYLALILGRGAFLACVLMNLNGMATKLVKLNNAKKLEPILKKWYALGGIKKFFIKTIEKGAKHKPLFLSKKARARFAKQMKTPLNGLCSDDECINAAPLAAVAAAAIPVIAALVPIMVKAFKGMGKDGAAESDELTAQAQDITTGAFTTDESRSNEVQFAEVPESFEGVAGYDTINANDELWGALGQMAGKGLESLVNKIKAKKPKLGKIIDKGAEVADDYATGQYMRTSGYKDRMIKLRDGAQTAQSYMLPVAIGAAVIFALKGKK